MLTLVCRTGATGALGHAAPPLGVLPISSSTSEAVHQPTLGDAPHAVDNAVAAQPAFEHGAMHVDHMPSDAAPPLDVSAGGTCGVFILLLLVDCMICHLIFCWFSAVIQME